MIVKCVWEHNGDDTLLHASEYIGAFARGASLDEAKAKLPKEINLYLNWCGGDIPENISCVISEEKCSDLNIMDADSDVIFKDEKEPLTIDEYKKMKALALKSAKDFLALYESIPDKNAIAAPARKTFYGQAPRSAKEMYEHTKNVNEYYFAELDVTADNEGDIYECRKRGFENIEKMPDFPKNTVIDGSYGELWSLRKVLRRFIWHDRIHAKAMYRMATKIWDKKDIKNPFFF